MFLQVFAEPRYWEDATINGEREGDDPTIPMVDGSLWCPIINLHTGEVLGWSKEVVADIHYKVCDAGEYRIVDEAGVTLYTREGYVPDVLCPEENGYGDYIIMTIENGKVRGWTGEWDDGRWESVR